jgi:hypothetical protein
MRRGVVVPAAEDGTAVGLECPGRLKQQRQQRASKGKGHNHDRLGEEKNQKNAER